MHIKPIVLGAKTLDTEQTLQIAIRSIKNSAIDMSSAIKSKENDPDTPVPNTISERAYAYIMAIAEIFKPLGLDKDIHNYLLWVWYTAVNISILDWQPWTPEKLDTIFGENKQLYFSNLDGEVISVEFADGPMPIDLYKLILSDGARMEGAPVVCDYLQTHKMVQVNRTDKGLVVQDYKLPPIN